MGPNINPYGTPHDIDAVLESVPAYVYIFSLAQVTF